MAKKNIKSQRGRFITFEGCEGSGKSTHAKSVYKFLKEKGFKVLHIREPGGTKISEKIRKILLDPCNKEISDITEMLLYMAARAQLVKDVIKPALAKGYIVLCDRFLDATVSYQGYGLGVKLGVIKYIGNVATGGIKPDLTILLDIPIRLGLERAGRFKDRIERRKLGYHLRVRKGYKAQAQQNPKRIKIVRVKNQDRNRVQSEIRNLISKYVISRYKRTK